MASKEGMSQNEIELQKTLFAMSEMVKVLYEDYLEQKRPFQGESSKQGKIEEGEDHPKPPPSPPSSPSSTSSSSSKSATSTARKHDMPLLKIDVKFELPMYDGEVNCERLDNWVR
jgi:hypothetical protein